MDPHSIILLIIFLKIIEIAYFHSMFYKYQSITIIPNLLLKLGGHLLWVKGYHEKKYHDMFIVIALVQIIEFVIFIFPEDVRGYWVMKKNQRKYFWPIYGTLLLFVALALYPNLMHLI